MFILERKKRQYVHSRETWSYVRRGKVTCIGNRALGTRKHFIMDYGGNVRYPARCMAVHWRKHGIIYTGEKRKQIVLLNVVLSSRK